MAAVGYFLAIIYYVLLLSSWGLKPVSAFRWPTWDDIVYRQKVTVKITNTFSIHNVVTVHCESWNDDLGVHELRYGEDFHFSFVPDIFSKTTFTCQLDLVNEHGQAISMNYDLYWAVRDINRCGTDCVWLLNESGLLTYYPREERWRRMYNWDSNQQLGLNDG